MCVDISVYTVTGAYVNAVTGASAGCPRRREPRRTPPPAASSAAARPPSPFATTLLPRRVTRPATRRRAPRPPTTIRRVLRLATPRRAPRPPTALLVATTLTTAETATIIAVTAPPTAATATTSARTTSDDLVDTRRLVAFEYFSRIFPSSLRVRVLPAHFLHTYPRLRRHRAFASRSRSTSRHFPRSSS